MGLMSYIHKHLLRKGKLSDLLPDDFDLSSDDTLAERRAARDDIKARVADERQMNKEVASAVRRLEELDRKNHYGESLKRAFGGR